MSEDASARADALAHAFDRRGKGLGTVTIRLPQVGIGRISGLRSFVGRVLAGLLVAAAVALPSRAGDEVVVSQRNREFNPNRLALKRGTVVHIVNDDKATHHVFIDTAAMRFDSGEQPVGKSIDVQFDRTGSFPVQCAIHPTMHLDVDVD
jgi:plastocyanin